jgi:hypothetical protein
MPALDDLVALRVAKYRATFGAGLNCIIPSVAAQQIGIEAEREFLAWQGQQAVYNSQYPNTAQGQALDYVASITGTVRGAATAGTVLLSMYVKAGCTVAAGQIVSAGANTAQWITTEAAVNAGADGWITGVLADCQTKGPIQAVAGSIRTSITSDPNWVNAPGLSYNVTNPDDAVMGVNAQNDTQLNASRKAELSASGGSSVDAICAHILQIKDPSTLENAILSARVFENVTDAVDVDSNDPHSIRAIVQRVDGVTGDPIDQLIANQVWGKAGGIKTMGSVSKTVVDSAGGSHTINFDRPSLVNVYIAITMTMGTATAAEIKAALAVFGATYTLGQIVVANQLYGPLYAASGGGEVTALYIGTSAWPVTAVDVDPTAYGLAVFDTTKIHINGA